MLWLPILGLVLGFAFMAMGVLPTPWVSTLGSLALLQVFGGVGRGIVYTLLLSLALKDASTQDRAAAMGMFQALYAFGMFVGPSLSGGIAEHFGLNAVFLVSGSLCIVCLPAVLAIRRRSIAVAVIK